MRQPLRSPPVVYFVIFQPAQKDADMPWWWRFMRRYLKPGYGHVSVIFRDTSHAQSPWIAVESRLGDVFVRGLPAQLTTQQMLAYYPGTEYVAIERWRDIVIPAVRGPITCVSVAKAMIGLQSWAITPWQLRCAIARLIDGKEAQARP